MSRKLILPLFFFFLMVTLPYIVAWQAAGSQHQFAGFLFNVYDGNSYLAKMYEGFRGEWKFTLPYTAEPGSGAYLFLFYIFLGHVSRWTSIPSVILFHLARVIGAACLAAALYSLVVKVQDSKAGAAWGYSLALLGAGLGWLLAVLGQLGADFWVAEAYPFLSSYATPHFALGLALLAWIFVEASRPAAGRRVLGLACLSALLSVIAPFGVVVAAAVLASLAAWQMVLLLRRRNEVQHIASGESHARKEYPAAVPALVLVLVGGGPFLIYQLLAIQSDPQLSGWNAQNVTPSIDPLSLAAALSPAFLFALLGFILARRRMRTPNPLFGLWLLAGVVLLYVPFDLQRRFMMGLFIPAACLAVAGIQALAGNNPRKAGVLGAALLLFSLPTNLLILVSTLQGISSRDPMVYLTADEAQALQWLELNSAAESLVLSSPEMGLFIPAQTGRRVIYGHPFETVDAAQEKQAVTDFFTGSVEMDREGFLAERQVDYVLYGERERRFQPGQVPAALQTVFSGGTVVIYAVPDSSK